MKRKKSNSHDVHNFAVTERQKEEVKEARVLIMKWAVWDCKEQRLVDKRTFKSYWAANKRAETLNQEYGCVRFGVVVGY